MMLMMLANRSDSTELFRKPAHGVPALDPESITRGFRLPGGEHQRSKDELCAERELHAECPRSHRPTWMDFERFPLPDVPLSMYHHQIFVRGTRKQ
jgi:hypothetical protein